MPDFKLDTIKRWEDAVQEDAPANSAAGGGVAGIGIGPKGEPGVDLRKKKLDDMTRDAHLDEESDQEKRMRLANAYEDAFDKVLGDDYGNFMEDMMVTQEMADDGDPKVVAKLKEMTARLARAKAAGEAARKKASLHEGKAEIEAGDEARYKWLSGQLTNFAGISPMGTFVSPLHATQFKQLAKEYKQLRKKLKKDQRPVIKEAKTIRLPKGLKEDTETFAGARVFEVDMDKVMSSRFGKNRYHRYSKYVGEDEKGEEIRQHGRTRGSGDIILKDSKTAVMTYLRRKKPVGQ